MCYMSRPKNEDYQGRDHLARFPHVKTRLSAPETAEEIHLVIDFAQYYSIFSVKALTKFFRWTN
jgi:hypothetical protein